MSTDPFSIESILDELKQATADPDAKDMSKYIDEQEKFNTQALLDEILGHSHDSHEDTLPEEPTPASEDAVSEPIAEETPSTEESAPSHAEQEAASEAESSPVKMTQSTEKSVYKSMLSETTQLKYMNLKKNREERVKNFVLKADLTDSFPHYKNLSPEEVGAQLNIEAKEPDASEPTLADSSADTSPKAPAESAAAENSAAVKKGSDFVEQWKEKMAAEAEELSDMDEFTEYTDPSQTEQVLTHLQGMKHSLLTKLWILGALFVLSFGLSLINDLGGSAPIAFLSITENPVAFCVLQALFLAGTFITCFDTVKNGLLELLRKAPGRNSIYSIAMMGTLVFTLVLLTSPKEVADLSVQLYIPFLIFTYLVMTVGRFLGIHRILTNFLLVSGDAKYSISILDNRPLAEELTKGALDDFPVLVYPQKTPFLSEFFNESYSEDITDRSAKYLVPIVSGIALLAAVISFVLGNTIFSSLSVFSGILIAGCGVLTFFVSNYPLYTCSKNLSRLGGAVLGYHAAEDFSEINSALIEANDLFGKDDVTLYGIKTFSSLPVDQVIINATSVLCETKSILAGVFLNIINNRQDFLLPVDTILYEDGMGISAWVNNSRILIGSRELMIHHNIPVPNEEYEKNFQKKNRQLLYIATSGELSAIFVIGISGSEETRNMLVDLYNHGMVCVIRSVDPFLTKEFLTATFAMPEDTFRLLPSHLQRDCEDLSESEAPQNGAVCSNGNFPAYLYSLLSAKWLNKFFRFGIVLQYVSIALAVMLLVVFAFIPNGLNQLSNVALCIISGIWLVLSLLFQKTPKI